MDYSVRPTRGELEKIRNMIDNTVKSYSYGLETNDFEVFLGWQRTEEDLSVLEVKDNEITIAVNPESEEYENADQIILRALLEAEFMEKIDYEEIVFKWQEVLKFAYVSLRTKELAGLGLESSEILEEYWPRIRDQLGEKTSEYNQFYYMNTLVIGEAVANQLEKNHEAEDLLEMQKSDVESAGEAF